MDPDFLRDFRRTLDEALARLSGLSDPDAGRPGTPGKWSPKEIIGHLIDSASNNHGRFVRAQLTDDLFFPGYDQEGWVRVQHYARANWNELIALWRVFNHHIAGVVEQIPPNVANM